MHTFNSITTNATRHQYLTMYPPCLTQAGVWMHESGCNKGRVISSNKRTMNHAQITHILICLGCLTKQKTQPINRTIPNSYHRLRKRRPPSAENTGIKRNEKQTRRGQSKVSTRVSKLKKHTIIIREGVGLLWEHNSHCKCWMGVWRMMKKRPTNARRVRVAAKWVKWSVNTQTEVCLDIYICIYNICVHEMESKSHCLKTQHAGTWRNISCWPRLWRMFTHQLTD